MKKQTVSLALALSVLAAGGLGTWYAHASASGPSGTPVAATQAETTDGKTIETAKAKESGEKTEAEEAEETPEAPEKAATGDQASKDQRKPAEEDEAQEATALAREAAMSKPEAEQRALAQVPGTAVKTTLDRENGRIVYEVSVKQANGRIAEVKVDAKTGAILHGEPVGKDQEDVEHRD